MKDPQKEKDPAAVALGSKGGKKRAENLTEEQLTRIGKKGAKAAWAKKRAAVKAAEAAKKAVKKGRKQ